MSMLRFDLGKSFGMFFVQSGSEVLHSFFKMNDYHIIRCAIMPEFFFFSVNGIYF